jgi:hypothetical protein
MNTISPTAPRVSRPRGLFGQEREAARVHLAYRSQGTIVGRKIFFFFRMVDSSP